MLGALMLCVGGGSSLNMFFLTLLIIYLNQFRNMHTMSIFPLLSHFQVSEKEIIVHSRVIRVYNHLHHLASFSHIRVALSINHLLDPLGCSGRTETLACGVEQKG